MKQVSPIPHPDVAVNLFDLKPIRNLEWEKDEFGKVTLEVPRFRSVFALKWFAPLLARPTMKVKLDDLGSLFWSCCDGFTTVAAIADAMKDKYGDEIGPVEDRISRFLVQLERDKFVIINYHN
jgi:hypothetical protein